MTTVADYAQTRKGMFDRSLGAAPDLLHTATLLDNLGSWQFENQCALHRIQVPTELVNSRTTKGIGTEAVASTPGFEERREAITND